MRTVAQRIFRGLNRILLVGVVFEFYAAGLAVFGATPFAPHAAVGWILLLVGLVTALCGLVARPPRPVLLMSTGLVGLLILQPVLALAPVFRVDAPAVSAVHPVNAVLILGLILTVLKRSRPTPTPSVPTPRHAPQPAQSR